MARIAREVISDLETSIESAQTSVDLQSLPVIEADPTQMRQLFQNLLGNAIKFRSEERKSQLKVSASEIMRDGESFHRLEFHDNGIGFDPQFARKLFALPPAP